MAGPDNDYLVSGIQTEDRCKVVAKFPYRVADAPDTELTEAGEIFAYLGRIQVELLGQQLG
jgi:hypothetical protein